MHTILVKQEKNSKKHGVYLVRKIKIPTVVTRHGIVAKDPRVVILILLRCVYKLSHSEKYTKDKIYLPMWISINL